MKKTFVIYNNGEYATNVIGQDVEANPLYIGVEEIDGEFLLATNGDPLTLTGLEDADCEAEIEDINRIIADPATPWEECDEEDEEYVRGWLEAWGCE